MTDLPNMPHRGRLLDARLHLLDRQLLDDDDDPVGIVDDLELTDFEMDQDLPAGAEAPKVTALLSGQILATRIFGGEPPRSRLQEIPWNLVACVGGGGEAQADRQSVRRGLGGAMARRPDHQRHPGRSQAASRVHAVFRGVAPRRLIAAFS